MLGEELVAFRNSGNRICIVLAPWPLEPFLALSLDSVSYAFRGGWQLFRIVVELVPHIPVTVAHMAHSQSSDIGVERPKVRELEVRAIEVSK